MTPLIFEIILILGKFLAAVLLILLIPAFVIKLLKKDLRFGLAFCASVLIVFLTVVTTMNNQILNQAMEPFSAWGVEGVKSLCTSTWAFSGGAMAAFVYAAWLITETRVKSTKWLATLFILLGFALNFIAQVVIPIILFGDYGKTLALDDLPFLLVTFILTVSVVIYLCFSDAAKMTYNQ